MGLRSVQLEAAVSELDRRLEKLGPWQAAVGTVQRLQACGGARDGTGGLADAEDLGGVAVATEAHVDRVHRGTCHDRPSLARRRNEEIGDPRGTTVTGHDESEAARARPGQRALGHPGGESGCYTGIDGISALRQHPCARLGGQPVTCRNRAIHAVVISADELCACT